MNKNKGMVRMVELPETELFFLTNAVMNLAAMHMDLIRLYEKESHLKKHHKAYLHIRDHADEVCKKDKEKVKNIVDQVLCAPGSEKRDAEAECQNLCFCENCLMPEDGDVFDTPEGIVTMPTESLGIMQDDMLGMAEAIDHIAELVNDVLEGKRVTEEQMRPVIKAATKLSREVFQRWDNAKMVKLA